MRRKSLIATLSDGLRAFLFLSAFVAFENPTQGTDAAPSTKLFDESSDQVFKVGLAKSIDGELKGHGTGFVVSEAGLIATAFHVVESAIREHDNWTRPNIYVVRKGVRIKATIWAVDSMHDMAILKVPVTFPKFWPINPAELKRGTSLYLMGYPGPADFSIVNGTLQSTSLSQVLPTLQITAPIKGGMSGGPVLSSGGEVVGVILAQIMGTGDIALAGQGDSLKKLVAAAKDREQSPTNEALLEDVHRGYHELQAQEKKLLDKIFEQKTGFHGWMLPSASKDNGDAYCGESDYDLFRSGIHSVPARNCYFKMATDGEEVEFALEYAVVPQRSNQFLTANLSNTINNSEREWTGTRKKFGKFACDPDLHLKKNGVSYLVSICSRVSSSSMDAFHSVVRIASTDLNRVAIVGRMSLMGFTKENTRGLANQFINSLEVDREYEPEED